ncbi:AraC family transcriptional regulator [Anaeromicropila populeti]|uniref:AraC-type DNA-binding protein n=1 Tax=Anaeromicropila populeti TaxID=37658 RepID=A0A1I6IDX0_9FIRM|nr:AraC family transcriptional regulator [Anaeromicropila populeti]SFR64901.1 AraC-type DNA-binding protein [Anaeromicropila populeti]
MLGKEFYENITFANNYPFNVTIKGMSETFPAHWHNYAEVLIVLQDSIEYNINSIPYKLNKRDFLLVHPGELHSLVCNHKDLSSYILIQLDASFIFLLPEFKKHYYWIKTFHYLPYGECPALSDYMIELASEINDLFNSNALYKDAKIYARLLEMFAGIGEYVISDSYISRALNQRWLCPSRQSDKTSHQSEITQKMIDVCSYLSQNCTKDLTLLMAANYAGFSKYHFSRLFSEFTGSSFIEFLTNERLKQAVELLLNEKLSITDVAMMSGFSSISTFNRCFQKYKHDTPSNFRKKYTPMKSS